MDDVFEELAKKLDVLPDDIKKQYQLSVIEQVDEDAVKLNDYFLAHSGSETLNTNMYYNTVFVPDKYYIRTVDWDDKKIANELKGKSYGRDINKPRQSGKRNYSLRPATVHDLAYIINYGQLKDGKTARLGNYFITKGMRRIKNRENKIAKKFRIRLLAIAKKFE